jgi:hypothetical protein
MRDYHRRSDRPRLRKNEIELDITPLLERSATICSEDAGSSRIWEDTECAGLDWTGQQFSEDLGPELPCFDPAFGATRVDLLSQCPEGVGDHERKLYAQSKW